MRTGTQLCAPEGFEALCKGVRYHLLRSDPARQRVLLVEFQRKRQRSGEGQRSADIGSKGGASGGHPGVADQVAGGTYASYRPVLHFLSRHRFEQALERGLIFACETQDELPPWLVGVTIVELQAYAELRVGQKRSHAARIDQTLAHADPRGRAHPRYAEWLGQCARPPCLLAAADGSPLALPRRMTDWLLLSADPGAGERPDWLDLGGLRRAVAAAAAELCGAALPCLLEARSADESARAVPVDRCVVRAAGDCPVLWLRAGADYRLTVRGPDGSTVRQLRLRVAQSTAGGART